MFHFKAELHWAVEYYLHHEMMHMLSPKHNLLHSKQSSFDNSYGDHFIGINWTQFKWIPYMNTFFGVSQFDCRIRPPLNMHMNLWFVFCNNIFLLPLYTFFIFMLSVCCCIWIFSRFVMNDNNINIIEVNAQEPNKCDPKYVSRLANKQKYNAQKNLLVSYYNNYCHLSTICSVYLAKWQ